MAILEIATTRALKCVKKPKVICDPDVWCHIWGTALSEDMTVKKPVCFTNFPWSSCASVFTMLACSRSLNSAVVSALRLLRSNQVKTPLAVHFRGSSFSLMLAASLQKLSAELKLISSSSDCRHWTAGKTSVHANRRGGPHRKDTEGEVPFSLVTQSCGYIR